MKRKKITTRLFIFITQNLLFIACSTPASQDNLANTDVMTPSTTIEATATIEPTATPTPTPDLHEYDFTVTFAGDLSLADNGDVMPAYVERGEDLAKCIVPQLISIMQEADIMWINNEFTYSTTGQPLPDKAYTFRAHPSRVSILKELGVDIVGLANNHVYDYGKQAMLDTLDTLDEAGIPYVGAGRNLNEATTPYYMEEDGKTIAFVAASRAEKTKMTPQATEDNPGILRCYDNTLFLEEIKEARENADFVIALPHWGTEYSTTLEQVQIDTAKEYIDAGADAIIGTHTHCIQGFDFYNGKPIAYSLGNYWFNSKTLDSMLVTLHFYGDDNQQNLDVEIIPAIQTNYTTSLLTGEDASNYYKRLQDISFNAVIENGKAQEP